MAPVTRYQPRGANVANALRDLSARRGMDRFPHQQQGRGGRGMDAYPENQRVDSLLGMCSSNIFTLTVAEGGYLGGSPAGIDFAKASQVPSQSNPAGVLSPAWPDYNNSINYWLSNPVFARAMRFICPGDSASVAWLQSWMITPVVKSPQAMGYVQQNPIPMMQLVSPYQFQANIIDFMVNMVLDGWCYFNLSSPSVAPGNINVALNVLTDAPVRLSDQLVAPGGVLPNFPGAPSLPQGSMPGGLGQSAYNRNGTLK